MLRSTLNWDTFPTTTKKRTLLRCNFLFFFSKKKETVRELHRAGSFPRLSLFLFLSLFFFFFLTNEHPVSFPTDELHSAHVPGSASVFAAGLEHFMPCTRLPVLFMHFPACLDHFLFSHKVTYSSLCPCLSNGCYTVLHTFLSISKKMFYNMIPKNNLMNDSLKEF